MSKTVLICDDDTAILDVTQTILLLAGYRVKTSTTSDNIIEIVKEHNPDVILMDLWIPEIGGEKATEILKSNPETMNIPVILFSANNDIEKIAQKTHADGFLKKPYEIKDLEKVIATNLKQTIS